MKKDGTRNFYDTELKQMAEHPSERAMEIGRRPPYYLQDKKEKENRDGRDYRVSKRL